MSTTPDATIRFSHRRPELPCPLDRGWRHWTMFRNRYDVVPQEVKERVALAKRAKRGRMVLDARPCWTIADDHVGPGCDGREERDPACDIGQLPDQLRARSRERTDRDPQHELTLPSGPHREAVRDGRHLPPSWIRSRSAGVRGEVSLRIHRRFPS